MGPTTHFSTTFLLKIDLTFTNLKIILLHVFSIFNKNKLYPNKYTDVSFTIRYELRVSEKVDREGHIHTASNIFCYKFVTSGFTTQVNYTTQL